MAQSIRPRQRSSTWGRALSATALVGLLAAAGYRHLFSQSLSPSGQNAVQSQGESSEFSAATRVADPGARASAIQQFLVKYPNSPLRQTAIAQLMAAKREAPNGSVGNAAPAAPFVPRSLPQPAAATAAAAPAAASVSTPQLTGAPRDSLLQHAPKPADVAISGNMLTIKANNSTLSQILHDITSSTGMKVEGFAKDERIFGTYGPGESRQILLSLLAGSGYNVLMLGDVNGAPRQLSLSERTSANVTASAPVASVAREEDDDADQEVQQVPPQEQPQPNTVPVPARNPGEMQMDMQRLRQQQMQQTEQQQQQPQ